VIARTDQTFLRLPSNPSFTSSIQADTSRSLQREDSVLRFWWKPIAEANKEAEEARLLSDVYVGHGSPAFLTVTSMECHREPISSALRFQARA
jgi:hypothetical protein